MLRFPQHKLAGILFVALMVGSATLPVWSDEAREDALRAAVIADVQFHLHRALSGGPSTAVDCQRALALVLRQRAESASGVIATGEAVSISDLDAADLGAELGREAAPRSYVKIDAVGGEPVRVLVPLGEQAPRLSLFRRATPGLFLRAADSGNAGGFADFEVTHPGEYVALEEQEVESLGSAAAAENSKALLYDTTPTTSDPAARTAWGLYRVRPFRIDGPIPVVLVHGLSNDRWGEFIEWAAWSPEAAAFRKNFQLWNFFHEATGIDAPIGYSREFEAFDESIVAWFDRLIKEAQEEGTTSNLFQWHFPNGPFMMVTNSTGGTKARAFLKHFPEYADRVLAVAAIAAPHVGTPAATAEWVRHTFSRMVTADPTLTNLLLSGVIAEFFTTSFMRVDRQSDLDMGWGNFDAQGGFGLPTADFGILRPGTGIVHLTVSPRDANQTYARFLPGIDDHTFEPPELRDTFCGGMDEIMPVARGEDFIDKFFVYASYMSNPRDWLGITESAQKAAPEKAYEEPDLMTPLSIYLQNLGIELANLSIASMASAGSDVPLGVYAVNDGIIPLQSALLLDGTETELIYETLTSGDGYEYPVIPYQLRMDVINAHTLFDPDRLRILKDWTHLDTATGRYNRWTQHSELYAMVAEDLLSVVP